MWRNPSNNYEEYFRDHHPRESAQRRSQTSMESFNQPPHESEVWIESVERSSHTWTNYESFANDVFCQSTPHSQHQEDEESEDPETISMLLRVLEDRKKRFEETSEYLNRPTLYFDPWEAEDEIEEASNDEDMDVQVAQFTPKEEIEETPKDADMTLEGEVVEVFFPYYEIVVEHQDDQIYTQQQSLAEEEVEEIIQLHEDALDENALALIVAVMNEETLRYNNASIEYETNKEEDEVFQLYELPQKELHEDEVVKPKVSGSPTPRLQHPQGLRKRLEWRIKHKWKIKLHNV